MRGDLDQLGSLLAVARCGSFTAAVAERTVERHAVLGIDVEQLGADRCEPQSLLYDRDRHEMAGRDLLLRPTALAQHQERPELVERVKRRALDVLRGAGVVIQGMLPFNAPRPHGQQGKGIVNDFGDPTARFKLSNRGIIRRNIACGSCPPCHRKRTAQCSTKPPTDCYDWGSSAL